VGLSSPTGAADRRAGIVFGDAGEGGFYAHAIGDPAVFLAPTVLRDLVTHPAIDRSAFRVDPSTLSSVSLEHGSSRLVLSRAGTDLVRADQVDADAGTDAIAHALSSLYAVATLHPGPAAADEGMNHPTLVLDLATDSRTTTHLTIGAAASVDGIDAYFARARGIDATFLVPKAPVTALLAGW
jgi:hypothetical protein